MDGGNVTIVGYGHLQTIYSKKSLKYLDLGSNNELKDKITDPTYDYGWKKVDGSVLEFEK